jgi:hypothetical protein
MPPLETLLIREFGVVVSSAEAARLLGFRNTDALAKARGRGLLPIHMFRIPHRKGWFAETAAIAEWLSDAAAGLAKVGDNINRRPQGAEGEP